MDDETRTPRAEMSIRPDGDTWGARARQHLEQSAGAVLLEVLTDVRDRLRGDGERASVPGDRLHTTVQAAARVGEALAKLSQAEVSRNDSEREREGLRLRLRQAEAEVARLREQESLRDTGELVAQTAAAAAIAGSDHVRAERERRAALSPMGLLRERTGVRAAGSLGESGGVPSPLSSRDKE